MTKLRDLPHEPRIQDAIGVVIAVLLVMAGACLKTYLDDEAEIRAGHVDVMEKYR